MIPENYFDTPLINLTVLRTYNKNLLKIRMSNLDKFFTSIFGTSISENHEVKSHYQKALNHKIRFGESFTKDHEIREQIDKNLNSRIMKFIEILYKFQLKKNKITFFDILKYHVGDKVPFYTTFGSRIFNFEEKNSTATKNPAAVKKTGVHKLSFFKDKPSYVKDSSSTLVATKEQKRKVKIGCTNKYG